MPPPNIESHLLNLAISPSLHARTSILSNLKSHLDTLSTLPPHRSSISTTCSLSPPPSLSINLGPVKSTIALAFSKCVDTITGTILLATTHGDHTVKIHDTCGISNHQSSSSSSSSSSHSNNGYKLLRTLVGHPRTPWAVEFHPSDSSIVASGCLGKEVRIWNWREEKVLYIHRSSYSSIISVSFWPGGRCRRRVKFKGDSEYSSSGEEESSSDSDSDSDSDIISKSDSSEKMTEKKKNDENYEDTSCLAFATDKYICFWDYTKGNGIHIELSKTIRCVEFVPESSHDSSSSSRSSTTGRLVVGQFRGGKRFDLMLYEFDHGGLRESLASTSNSTSTSTSSKPRVLHSPKMLLENVLLYNDGGLDMRMGEGGEMVLIAVKKIDKGVEMPSMDEDTDELLTLPPTIATTIATTTTTTTTINPPTDQSCLIMISLPPTDWKGRTAKVVMSYRLNTHTTGITCCKFSPTGKFIVLGFGVRLTESGVAWNGHGESFNHQIVRIYGQIPVDDTTMSDTTASEAEALFEFGCLRIINSIDDDVNIVRFHPRPGGGLVLGTTQGKVKVLKFYGDGDNDGDDTGDTSDIVRNLG